MPPNCTLLMCSFTSPGNLRFLRGTKVKQPKTDLSHILLPAWTFEAVSTVRCWCCSGSYDLRDVSGIHSALKCEIIFFLTWKNLRCWIKIKGGGKGSIKDSVFSVCVCPVTALVSEVLNNDRNSRDMLLPAAPITELAYTMVSMATPLSASSPFTCTPPKKKKKQHSPISLRRREGE